MRILHLSDLHFGLTAANRQPEDATPSGMVSTHRFVKGRVPDPNQLAKVLKRDLTSPPDLVVVSGDLLSRAEVE